MLSCRDHNENDKRNKSEDINKKISSFTIDTDVLREGKKMEKVRKFVGARVS